jgi:hypothetical protein
MTVSNVGDSRAVLISAKRGITLTEDHKPSAPTEQRRIASFGGTVTYNTGIARVAGVLAVSRAFGNYSIRNFIRADPDIYERELTAQDDFLVLASDGLWDVFRANEVADICYNWQKHGVSRIADQLVQLALTRGSMDNVTAVVVSLSKYYDRMLSASRLSPAASGNEPPKRASTAASVLSGNAPNHSRLNPDQSISCPDSGYAASRAAGMSIENSYHDAVDDDMTTIDDATISDFESAPSRRSQSTSNARQPMNRKPPRPNGDEKSLAIDNHLGSGAPPSDLGVRNRAQSQQQQGVALPKKSSPDLLNLSLTDSDRAISQASLTSARQQAQRSVFDQQGTTQTITLDPTVKKSASNTQQFLSSNNNIRPTSGIQSGRDRRSPHSADPLDSQGTFPSDEAAAGQGPARSHPDHYSNGAVPSTPIQISSKQSRATPSQHPPSLSQTYPAGQSHSKRPVSALGSTTPSSSTAPTGLSLKPKPAGTRGLNSTYAFGAPGVSGDGVSHERIHSPINTHAGGSAHVLERRPVKDVPTLQNSRPSSSSGIRSGHQKM